MASLAAHGNGHILINDSLIDLDTFIQVRNDLNLHFAVPELPFEYIQGVRHTIFIGDGVTGGDLPWEEADDIIDNVESIIKKCKEINNPTPIETPIDDKLAEEIDGEIESFGVRAIFPTLKKFKFHFEAMEARIGVLESRIEGL